MASIRKRRNGYAVVYYYDTPEGERKQRWEQFPTYAEAHKRRAEVEYKQDSGDFIAPSSQTVVGLMEDFVRLYAPRKWGVSVYASNIGLINNYINPIIGNRKLQSINGRVVDEYIQTLLRTTPVTAQGRKPKSAFLTPSSVEKIIKLLRCAFDQAVRWELIPKNYFKTAILPKVDRPKREIWNAETIRKALDSCEDTKLYLAMNLSFACSLRLGEVLGLTWDNIHISDADVAGDDAHIFVDKELARVNQAAMEAVGEQDIKLIFPTVMARCKTTRMALKTPKTASSVRKVWLPKTVAYILREWRQAQEKQKEFLGDDYQDYNLVVAQSNGRPCESRLIDKAFTQLKADAGLPNVVFHSLRHSSTTYKLKLNRGDIKATQGDTGHAEADMVTKVYAHILDEDRKLNAQKFETAFYTNPDLRGVTPPATPNLEEAIAQIRNDPSMAAALMSLLQMCGEGQSH